MCGCVNACEFVLACVRPRRYAPANVHPLAEDVDFFRCNRYYLEVERLSR